MRAAALLIAFLLSLSVAALIAVPAAHAAAPAARAEAPADDEIRVVQALIGSRRVVRVTLEGGRRYDAREPRLGPDGLSFSTVGGGPRRGAIVTTFEPPGAPTSPIPWERIAKLEAFRTSIDGGLTTGIVLGALGAGLGLGFAGVVSLAGGEINAGSYAAVGGAVPFVVSTLVGSRIRHYTTIYDAALRPLRSGPADAAAGQALDRMLEGADYVRLTTGAGVYRVSDFQVEDDGLRFGEARTDRGRPGVAHDAPPPAPPLQSPVPWERIQTIERPRSQVGRGAAIGFAVGVIAMVPAGIALAASDPDGITVLTTTTLVLGVPTVAGALLAAPTPRYEIVYDTSPGGQAR